METNTDKSQQNQIVIPPYVEYYESRKWRRICTVLGMVASFIVTYIIVEILVADKQDDPSARSIGTPISMMTFPITTILGYFIGFFIDEQLSTSTPPPTVSRSPTIQRDESTPN